MDKNDRQTNIEVEVVGFDGNIFSILGKVHRAMKREGFIEEAELMWKEVKLTHSYDEALVKIQEFVELI